MTLKKDKTLMSTLSLNLSQICHVAELLLGAANADGDFDGHEAETIGDILRSLVPGQALPGEVTSHLAQFDVDELDLAASTAPLRALSEASREAILNLVVKVVDADEVHDMAEDHYIQQVAEALGVDDAHADQFTVDIIEITDLPTPPPLPQ